MCSTSSTINVNKDEFDCNPSARAAIYLNINFPIKGEKKAREKDNPLQII